MYNLYIVFPTNLILPKSTETIENIIGTIILLTYLGPIQRGYCLTLLYLLCF